MELWSLFFKEKHYI